MCNDCFVVNSRKIAIRMRSGPRLASVTFCHCMAWNIALHFEFGIGALNSIGLRSVVYLGPRLSSRCEQAVDEQCRMKNVDWRPRLGLAFQAGETFSLFVESGQARHVPKVRVTMSRRAIETAQLRCTGRRLAWPRHDHSRKRSARACPRLM